MSTVSVSVIGVKVSVVSPVTVTMNPAVILLAVASTTTLSALTVAA